MNLIKVLMFAFVFLISTNLFAENRYKVKSAVVDYDVIKGDKLSSIKLLFNDYGNKLRVVLKFLESDIEMYTLYFDNKAFAVNDNKQIFLSTNIEDLVLFHTLEKSKMEIIGKEKILGKLCSVYKRGKEKFWLYNGVVLKVESSEDDGNMVAKSYIEVETPLTAFEIPKGYTQVKIPLGF